jgi:hypothetical protein
MQANVLRTQDSTASVAVVVAAATPEAMLHRLASS